MKIIIKIFSVVVLFAIVTPSFAQRYPYPYYGPRYPGYYEGFREYPTPRWYPERSSPYRFDNGYRPRYNPRGYYRPYFGE